MTTTATVNKVLGYNKLERFANGLTAAKLIVNVRRSRGKDIDAACGQLANKLGN